MSIGTGEDRGGGWGEILSIRTQIIRKKQRDNMNVNGESYMSCVYLVVFAMTVRLGLIK